MVFIIVLMITVINQIFDNNYSLNSGLLLVMFVEESLAIGYGTFHICKFSLMNLVLSSLKKLI